MDLITYTRDYDEELKDDDVDTREATEISFEVANDLTIYEFKIICKRLAAALGYAESSIQDAFGDDEEDTMKSKQSLLEKIRKNKPVPTI